MKKDCEISVSKAKILIVGAGADTADTIENLKSYYAEADVSCIVADDVPWKIDVPDLAVVIAKADEALARRIAAALRPTAKLTLGILPAHADFDDDFDALTVSTDPEATVKGIVDPLIYPALISINCLDMRNNLEGKQFQVIDIICDKMADATEIFAERISNIDIAEVSSMIVIVYEPADRSTPLPVADMRNINDILDAFDRTIRVFIASLYDPRLTSGKLHVGYILAGKNLVPQQHTANVKIR